MKDSKIILKAVDGWTQRTLGLFLTALEKDQSLNIICSDGSVKSSILILAAISPVLKEIGRQFPACCQDIFHVILPDFCVSQIERFLENLGSEKGPQNSEESFEFERILAFFGRQSFLPSVGIKDEVPMSNLDKIPFSDFVPDSYETNLEECWPTSEDVKEEDEEMISPKFSGKSSKVLREFYDESRRLFVCPKCGTERKRWDRLAVHLQWHANHPGENYETRYNCPHCGKHNATQFMLRMHITRMHTDLPKEFECIHPGCRKSFRFKGELKIHGLTHSQEKKFVCSQCGERFRSKGQMELHWTRRHDPETRANIPCEECGKLFRLQADLRNHLSRTHRARLERQHRCHSCDLTFRGEKALLAHLALHDPSRPLPCSRCTLRYKNRDALVAHEKTHDQAQFTCHVCLLPFKRKDNLKRHIKSKHPLTLQKESTGPEIHSSP